MYWEAITSLEAQEMLLQMKLHDYPYMEKQPRLKFYRQMEKLSAPPTNKANEKPKTMDDVIRKLASGGRIG